MGVVGVLWFSNKWLLEEVNLNKDQMIKALNKSAMRKFSGCQSGHAKFFDWYLSKYGGNCSSISMSQFAINARNYDIWVSVKVNKETKSSQARKYGISADRVRQILEIIDRLITKKGYS